MENLFSPKQNKMSGEMGALDCRHLKLPQVTPEFLGKVITHFVQDISHDEWNSLDAKDPGSEVAVLLFDMCCAVIGEIGALVLEAVEPQVLASGHYHLSGDNAAVQSGCSYCRVTEEDIQACFGNSFYLYFDGALDVAQESSYNLDQLVRLFSAEITKRVNSSLARITGSALSSDMCNSPTAECILQMVCNIGNTFKNSLEGPKRMKYGSCDNLACPDCNCEPCCCFDFQADENVEQDSAEIVEISDCLSESSACMDHLNPEPAPQLSDSSESQNILNSQQMDSSSSRSPSPDYLINQSFLSVLLGKLVDHIAVNTRTSILNLDFEQLVYGVTRRTEGMLKFAPPQSVDDLHIRIYENLCWNFETKYVLQAVMESGDEAFESTISETLISQLNLRKATKKRKYFKVGNLSPIPELEEPEPEPDSRQPTAECVSQMAYNRGNILKGRKRVKDGSCDNLACPDCDCEPCCCFDFQDDENVEQDRAEIVEISDCLSESSACMDHLNPEPAPQLYDCSESQNILNSQQMDTSSSRSPSPDYQINQSFLSVLLGKLVDHIVVNTRTSILNVDFEQLVYGVMRRTEGMLKFAPPHSVDDLHIPIYENLCWKFESKYVLQAVMESGDEAFESAISETLISQLNLRKATKKRKYFKVGNLSPIPELEEPEPESDSRQPTAECVSQMAYNRGNILEGRKRVKDGSCDNLACPDCDCEPCCCFDFQDDENVEQDRAEIVEISDCLSESSACMDHLNPEPAPQLSDCSQNILNSQQMDSSSSHALSPDYLINLNFLIVLLSKLVDHIASKTRTSIVNVDFEQLVNGVIRRIQGVLNLAPLKCIDNLHIPIYKELCRKSTSKYVLQAVMASGHEAFESAISETLISQLNLRKAKKKRKYFKVGNLSPIPELEEPEPEPDREERSQQTAPSPSNR